jgi:peptidoglycan/xylan/chitin deacetylase (PgdA/CDA1 family)
VPSRREILRLAAGVGAFATAGCAAEQPGPASSAPTVSASPATPVTIAAELVRANTGRPEVSLTFHGAGDLQLTRQALDLLANRGALVTVLAVGTWLDRYPDAGRMVRDGGHDLGNHTWSHPVLAGLAPAAIRDEIERCRDRLVAVAGDPGPFFRQSAAQYASDEERRLAAAAGYRTVLSYDVDSTDWTDPGPQAIRRAVATARPGSVVSMHLGHAGTVAALPAVLDDLAGRGLAAVPASRLFG